MSSSNEVTGSPFEIIAATFTPFANDGSIAFSRIAAYARHLVDSGVDGVFICGTSGEGFSLSVAERKELAVRWIEASSGKLRVIVHIGHTALPDSVELGRHAAAVGADAISAIGPIFFPPTLEGFIDYNRKVAASAPELPYFYYHFPNMSRIDSPASAVYQQLVDAVPNFRGVKFTDEDLEDFSAIIDMARDNDQQFFGRDEMLFEALQSRARAVVGSTYNFNTPLYRRIVEAFERCDFDGARLIQKKATAAIDLMKEAGGLGAIRTLMSRFGIDCGQARSPLPEPPADARQNLVRQLEKMGYWKV